ncbi:MAG: PstS family phosphate ABC transporter substrate-binding protein [Chloroflexota bacterium]|nr:PstS family phosphate ABC transporter substrate-binding protein [Chloroflexota bacterium]
MSVAGYQRSEPGPSPALVRLSWAFVVILALALTLGGSTAGQEATPAAIAPYAPGTDPASLGGRVVADGSSTVWPITVEVAERFADVAPAVQVEVEISGTGGGFERFCAGETDVQNASHPIEPDEAADCAAAGVTYHAFEIGFDGITVVVNPVNDYLDCLTVDQLRQLWEPDSPERVWSDLNPDWPNEAIDLYGPGSASGTFDYFTEVIVGEEGASRTDYTPSENDLVLVEGVASDPHAPGYFGYAYYAETQDRPRAVAIDAGAGCVIPTLETIGDRSYEPLSRPLFVYVSEAALARPEVREFMRYHLASASDVVTAVGYVPIAESIYASNQAELDQMLGEELP